LTSIRRVWCFFRIKLTGRGVDRKVTWTGSGITENVLGRSMALTTWRITEDVHSRSVTLTAGRITRNARLVGSLIHNGGVRFTPLMRC
jgi:hypothetical protein